MVSVSSTVTTLAAARAWWLWSLAYVIVSVALFNTYYIDDAFIHARYAKHLAEGFGFVFNPGDPTSYGTSSPLYTMALAFAVRLVPDPLLAAKGIGLLCGAAAIAMFHRMLRHGAASHAASAGLVVGAMLLWVSNVTLLRWSNSGMETSLWVLLQVVSFDCALRAGVTGRLALYAAAGACAGAGVLTRPEGAVWALAIVLIAFLAGRRTTPPRHRSWSGMLVMAAVACVLLAPWTIYAISAFGSIVPNTVLAKGAARPLFDTPVVEYGRAFLVNAGDASLPVILPLGAAVLMIMVSAPRLMWGRLSPHVAAGLVFPILLFSGYWAANGAVSSRYLCIFFVPSLWLWTVLTTELAREASAPSVARSMVGWSCVWALVSAAAMGAVAVPQARRHAASNDRVRDMGRWIAAHTNPAARVAAVDIGVIGYESNRYIVDVAGLATRDVIPHVVAGTVFQYLQIKPPDYLWIRDLMLDDTVPPDARPILIPIRTLVYDSFSLLDRTSDRYVLYRMDWTRLPGGLP